MSLELKKDCKYSLLVATSMGIRITPVNGQPVHSSHLYEMQATSAETNVASIASFPGSTGKSTDYFRERESDCTTDQE